jgi:hypothetical protein
MRDAYKEFGKTEFTTGEIHESLVTKFPTVKTDAKNIGASIASMKQAGIVVDLGFAPNSTKAKVFGLAEIVDSITAPAPETLTPPEEIILIVQDDLPGAVSPEAAAAVLRKLNSVQRAGAFTATVKEVAAMAQDNATNGNRKPREGTPEHDIMRLTRLADRQSETLEASAANGARLEKALFDATMTVRDVQSNQVRTGNELGEAQLAAMQRLREGVMEVMHIIATEIATTRADAQRNEKNMITMLREFEKSDEVDRQGYKRGFLDGFEVGQAQTEKDRDALNEEVQQKATMVVAALRNACGHDAPDTSEFLSKVSNVMTPGADA